MTREEEILEANRKLDNYEISRAMWYEEIVKINKRHGKKTE